MEISDICPQCNSDDISISKKRGEARCNDCSHTWSTGPAPLFIETPAAAIARRCQQLAAQENWLADVENTWPAPIAHEYQRLCGLLADARPDISGAVWQLKDVAEVLLKFPTLVLFRDLYEHGNEAGRRELLQRFLGKELSMGDWLGLALDLARKATTDDAMTERSGRRIASLYCIPSRKNNPAPTVLHNLLGKLVKWRNDEIGHGAFRLDLDEHLKTLEHWIPQLKQALQEHSSLWQGLTLVTEDGTEVSKEMLLQADGEKHAGHPLGKAQSLYLDDPHSSRLALSPYLSIRTCSECDKCDIFFFDTYKKRDSRSFFLDYYRGHKISQPDHLETAIAGDFGQVANLDLTEEIDSNATAKGGDYAQASIRQLLEERQLAASAIRPDYLRKPLLDFVEGHDQGVYWLKAPGHVGKTVFVADLVRRPLRQNIRTCAYHIKREYNCHPAQFGESLGDALRAATVLDLSAGIRELPRLQLDLPREECPRAFAEWLASLQYASTFSGPLLICIDGLDELPDPKDGLSIADYLPTSGQLPDNVFLLLTSRPERDCPAWLDEQLARLAADPGSEARNIDLRENAEYHALMRDFFLQRLELQWKNAVTGQLEQASDALASRQPDGLPKGWPAFAESEFKRLGKKNWQAVQAAQADFEAMFLALLDKADYRFLFLTYLADTLQYLPDWRQADGIPAGEAMLKHFIGQLGLALSDKAHDLAMRVLLLLAAAEEAHAQESNWLTSQEGWRGLPLDTLAALLNEGGVSSRLVFILYTLKTVLASDKTDAADESRFALGLKGLGATLRRIRGPELDALHERLARQFLGNWRGRYADIPETDPAGMYLLGLSMAHVHLARSAQLSAQLSADFAAASVDLVNQKWLGLANRQQAVLDKLPWFDRIIEVQRRHLAQPGDGIDHQALEVLYFQNRRLRAYAWRDIGRFGAARDELHHLRNEEFACQERDIQAEGSFDGGLLLELVTTEQQLGWILRADFWDYDEALRHLSNCIERIRQFLPLIPLQDPLRQSLVEVTIDAWLQVAKCYRATSDRQKGDSALDVAEKLLDQAISQAGPIPKLLLTRAHLRQQRQSDTAAPGDRIRLIDAALMDLAVIPEAEQSAEHRKGRAALLNDRGGACCGQNQTEAAIAAYQEALRLLESCDTDSLDTQRRLAMVQTNLGGACLQAGQREQAIFHCRQACKLWDQIEARLPQAQWTQEMRDLHFIAGRNRNVVEHSTAAPAALRLPEDADPSAEPEKALIAWRKTLAAWSELPRSAENGPAIDLHQALCRMKIGIALSQSNLVAARQHFREAADGFAQCVDYPGDARNETLANMSTCLQWLGWLSDDDESLDYYREGLDVIQPQIMQGDMANADTYAETLARLAMKSLELERWPLLADWFRISLEFVSNPDVPDQNKNDVLQVAAWCAGNLSDAGQDEVAIQKEWVRLLSGRSV